MRSPPPRQHAFLRLLPLLWQAALWQRWAWLLQQLCYPCNGKLHSGNGEHGFFSPTLTTCVFLSIITGQGRSYSCNSLLALADNNYFRKLNVKYCSSIVSKVNDTSRKRWWHRWIKWLASPLSPARCHHWRHDECSISCPRLVVQVYFALCGQGDGPSPPCSPRLPARSLTMLLHLITSFFYLINSI